MTERQIAKELRELARRFKCPWGNPGSNPDYFSPEEYKLVRQAAAILDKVAFRQGWNAAIEACAELLNKEPGDRLEIAARIRDVDSLLVADGEEQTR